MALATLSTSNASKDSGHKVLLVAHHGWGKTYQCRFFEKEYGKGLIISGEAGLKSLEDCDIDYIPFSSWDGDHIPEKGIFSFRGIIRMMDTSEFEEAGYNWIAIDSLTEVSDQLMEYLKEKHKNNKNTFQIWGDYASLMLGALKKVRDMPLHVLVTCLAKEEKDPNDVTHYWPLVQGKGVSKQLPSIFDHVLCGVRVTDTTGGGSPTVTRYLVTEEVSGWHGKVRDPHNRLQPYERSSNIPELLTKMTRKEL